jgi:hypothetical protein
MAFCTAILGIPAIIFTATKVSLALNGSTTASWRCGWISLEHEGEVVVEEILEGMVVESSSSVPRGFGRMCRESVSSSQILCFFYRWCSIFVRWNSNVWFRWINESMDRDRQEWEK